MKDYIPPSVSIIEIRVREKVICASPVIGTEEYVIIEGGW